MRRDIGLDDFIRQFGDDFARWSLSPALRAVMDRCVIAASTKRHHETLPFTSFDHNDTRVLVPQSYAVPGARDTIAFDVVRGRERTVVTAHRREGMTFVLDDHLFLPPSPRRAPWFSSDPIDARPFVAPPECQTRFITPALMRLAGLSF